MLSHDPHDQLRSASDVELPIHALEIRVHGMRRDAKLESDALLFLVFKNSLYHLQLPLRQSQRLAETEPTASGKQCAAGCAGRVRSCQYFPNVHGGYYRAPETVHFMGQQATRYFCCKR